MNWSPERLDNALQITHLGDIEEGLKLRSPARQKWLIDTLPCPVSFSPSLVTEAWVLAGYSASCFPKPWIMRHKLKFSGKSPAKEGGMPFSPTSTFPLPGTPAAQLIPRDGATLEGGRAMSWERPGLVGERATNSYLFKASVIIILLLLALRVNLCVWTCGLGFST